MRRIIEIIKSIFLGSDVKALTAEQEKLLDEKIAARKRNLEIFHSIVGEDPMKQIDWIIENGLLDFNKWFRSYENGSIEHPKEIRQDTYGQLFYNESTSVISEDYLDRLKNKLFKILPLREEKSAILNEHIDSIRLELYELKQVAKNLSRSQWYVETVEALETIKKTHLLNFDNNKRVKMEIFKALSLIDKKIDQLKGEEIKEINPYGNLFT